MSRLLATNMVANPRAAVDLSFIAGATSRVDGDGVSGKTSAEKSLPAHPQAGSVEISFLRPTDTNYDRLLTEGARVRVRAWIKPLDNINTVNAYYFLSVRLDRKDGTTPTGLYEWVTHGFIPYAGGATMTLGAWHELTATLQVGQGSFADAGWQDIWEVGAVGVGAYNNSGAPRAMSYRATDAFASVEPAGSPVQTYFDGDSINARWQETAHKSRSELWTDTVGGRLSEALAPLAEPYDAQRGYPLARYADAIGGMFQPSEDIVRDVDRLVDPDRAPVGWLPWLGQFVGQPIAKIGSAESISTYRRRVAPLIKNPPLRRRGTVPALVEEVQAFLAAPRTVIVTERVGGNWATGTLAIIAAEKLPGVTLAQIQARINAVKPAGRLITVSEVTGQNWQALRDTHASWTVVRSTFVDWAEVRSNPTKL